MGLDIIQTNGQYIKALKRIILIMDYPAGTPESREMKFLLGELKKYEDSHMVTPVFGFESENK